MANFVYITLDTTAPANPVINISGGAIFTTNQLVNLSVSVDDANTSGYQMKIWGDVDKTYNTNIQDTEATSQWIPYSANPQVKLSSGDANKTLNLRVRDDVHNASSISVKSIKMDTNIPTVTVTLPDVSKISKVDGKDVFSFTFSVNEDFKEFKVKLVGATGATHDTGALIPTTNGSTGTSGTGSFVGGNVFTVSIRGRDLELAGATTDGQKIVKVFAKDMSDLWSA
jgi:hypothetical protein